MNNPRYLILLTILLWAFGGIFTRLISIDSPLLSLMILFFFTTVSIFLFALFEYKNTFLEQLQKVKWQYIFFGLFGYFFYYLGLTQSFHLFNSASETTILNYSFPIFTVLFTELTLKNTKKTFYAKLIEYLGIAIGFFSIVVLATQGNIFSFTVTNIPALLWGLSAAVAYGLFSVYSSKVTDKDQTIFLLVGVFASWILSLIISLPSISQLVHLPFTVYIVSIITAFIVNGLGYMAWTKANYLAKKQHISISSVVSLIFALPVISLILVSIFFHEAAILKPYFLFALLLLLLGTIFCQKSEKILSLFKKLFSQK